MTSVAWPASLPTPVICIRLWNKCLELIHTKSHFKHGWRALAIAESVMNSGFKSVTPGKQRSGRKSRRVSCSKFQIQTSKNLMTFGSLILKVKYRLLHSFFAASDKCYTVRLSSLTPRRFDKLSGAFFSSLIVQCRLKVYVFSISIASYNGECHIWDALLIAEGGICLSAWPCLN